MKNMPENFPLSATLIVLSDEHAAHLARQLTTESPEARKWILSRATDYADAQPSWAPRECEHAAHLDYEIFRLIDRSLEVDPGKPLDKRALTAQYFNLMEQITRMAARADARRFA